MKPIRSIALAMWLLEHWSGGLRCESLVGDLLEEFRSGRSAGWFWRQAMVVIAIGLSGKMRGYVVPLGFAAGWSLLYPTLWPSILGRPVSQRLLERLAMQSWPYSTGLHAVSELLPAMMFVGLGFSVYLIASGCAVGALRAIGSLSIGLNVLIVAMVGSHIFGTSRVDMRSVSPENFRGHLVASSIPLALSLYAALLCALSAVRRERGTGVVAG
jgi:hypothetical protein